jgi:carboxyvinyl-carboxyphosphonate phosphorylmutase
MSQARERFRQILARPACTPAAPIFDPLSARIADMLGWEVCKLSGSVGKFANLAVPDGVPLSNMSDLVDLCWRINRVTDTCLIADADEGGGSALNVFRTVRELEAVGVVAIELEDNLVPSRFGEAESRHSLMIPVEEQVDKLKAAVAARRDPSTVIVARTVALAELPLNEALERIKAYSQTGAEAIMLPGVPRGRADIEALHRTTSLPLFVLGAPPDDASAPGFLAAHGARIFYLGLSIYAMAVKALHDGLKHLKDGGSPADLKDRSAPKELIEAVNRTDEFMQWQQKFMK